jgi:hypothetical protein
VRTAASDQPPPTGSADGERQNSWVRWSVAGALTVFAACAFSAGLASYMNARDRHSNAAKSLDLARVSQHQLYERIARVRLHGAALQRELGATRAARARLRVAQRSGFAVASETAGARAATAGEAAGIRAGRQDGHAQRSEVPAGGWYLVHVSWRGGLPVIDDAYSVEPGAENAYWVENGKAYQRTTG